MSHDMRTQTVFVVILGLLLSASAGCGDVELEPANNNSEDHSEDNSQSAMVTPEFSVSGLEDVPEELMLQKLGLSVAEIRLEPLRGSEGFVYATSEPFSLTFDLESGENTLRGEPVKFPEVGRFLVSIRLEPLQEQAYEGEEFDAPLKTGSLGVKGKVRSNFLASEKPPRGVDDEDGEVNDGNPLPLPAERLNDDDDMWTPFALSSDRAVVYTFSDVELTWGEQALAFEFDVNDWASEVAAPIVDAAENREGSEEVIDIEREVDSPSSEPEALLGTGSVSTAAH